MSLNFESMYTYSDSNGVVIPDTSTVKQDLTQAVAERLGLDAATIREESIAGRIIEMLTIQYTQTLGVCAQNVNQMNLGEAAGAYLDSLARFFNLQRRGRQRSRVAVSIYGGSNSAGQTLTSVLAKTSAGDVFYLENPITLDESGYSPSGTYMVSEEYGAIPCGVNGLSLMTFIGAGATISNSSEAVLGNITESDSEFRKRIADSRYTGYGWLDTMKGTIESIDGVQSVNILENNTGGSMTINGVTVNAHSVFICVKGGDSDDICEAVFKTKCAGCGYGDGGALDAYKYVGTVTDAFGNSVSVTIYRPADLQIYAKVSVKDINYVGTDLEKDVKDAVKKWADNQIADIDGLRIGFDVSAFEMAAAVSDMIPTVKIVGAFVGTSSSPSTTSVSVSGYQLCSIEDSRITVEIT